MSQEALGSFDFDVREYFRILWRRKWVVVLAMVVVTSTGLFRSLGQENVYRATSDMVVDLEVTGPPNIETQVRLLESEAVRAVARKELPDAGKISGSQVGNSKVISVVSESTDPKVAARTADVYVKAFIEYRREQELNRLLSATEQARRKIDEIRIQVNAVTEELDTVLASIAENEGPSPGESNSAALARQTEVDREKREADTLRARRDNFLSQSVLIENKLRDLEVANDFTTGSAQQLTPASVPTSPIRPRPLDDGITAAMLGLILGVALAYLFEYLDDSVKNKDDVQRAVGPDVPVIATIPIVAEWRDRTKTEVVTLTAPRSSAAEAYRALRTSVQFASLESPVGSLAITSSRAGEGKTTVLANLAVVMAGAGRRVVILDCDLRRPRVHAFFGMSNEVGFTSWIIGDAPLSAALREVPGVRRLSMMASGPIPPNPSELLTSRRFPELVKALQADGALVLIDTPPLLPVTDAAVIARSIDKIVMVAAAGSGSRKDLRHAVDVLRQIDAPLAGLVLNRVDPQQGYYAAGYYGPEQAVAASPAKTRRPRFGGPRNSEGRRPARSSSDSNGNGKGSAREGSGKSQPRV